MWWIVVIGAIVTLLWLARLAWGTLLYWGTPMLAVYFPDDGEFARTQANMLEKLGNSFLGEGRAWTDRGRQWALRVVFVVNPDDQSALAKLLPLFQMSALIHGATTTAKPAGALKFAELPLPAPEIPVTVEGEEAGQWDDEYDGEDEGEDRDAA